MKQHLLILTTTALLLSQALLPSKVLAEEFGFTAGDWDANASPAWVEGSEETASSLPVGDPSWVEDGLSDWDENAGFTEGGAYGDVLEEARVGQADIPGEDEEEEGDTPLSTRELMDLLDQAAADAAMHAEGEGWFAAEEGGAGKGSADLTPTPADPTKIPLASPTPGTSPTPAPKPDFTVEKKAMVSQAKPGDTVIYTIRIVNTGNVTLHSVISTERFQGAGVKAYFEEQPSVTYNESHTQAAIAALEPGKEVTLTAYVVIPYTAQAQKLVNQVDVTTEETGPVPVTATDSTPLIIPVASSTPCPDPTRYQGGGGSASNGPVQTGGGSTASVQYVPQNTANVPVTQTEAVKTGDDNPLAFLFILLAMSGTGVLLSLFSLGTRTREGR